MSGLFKNMQLNASLAHQLHYLGTFAVAQGWLKDTPQTRRAFYRFCFDVWAAGRQPGLNCLLQTYSAGVSAYFKQVLELLRKLNQKKALPDFRGM
ncbi:hypothetical protein CKO25_20220 [Thiocapsa imhoffii]|uniref:Uncharacterized protein n=2 Tax=Thiocapsa imhoffii TaxID=382777 RepID=A0A9X0WLE5_9GAMM|nr:hypothetical protein [Thiocapsa imhoffii]